jgi:small conductance mechanosensitive channel
MNFDISEAWVKIQQMVNQLITALPNIVLAFIVFVLFYFIAKGIKIIVQHFTRKHQRHYSLELVLGRLFQWLVVLVGLLVALSIVVPSFKAGDLIELLGIGGVAIGFAFREIFQNFLAGILLLITEPFRIGDQIVVDSFEGTVEGIETRATTIKTYDGRRVVIPSSDLFTKSVIVNTAFDIRRTEYDVGIGYGDDIDRVKGLILEAMRQTDGVLKVPPPDVLTVKLDNFTVNICARWWSGSRRADVLEVQDKVITTIKNKLTQNGIDLPFPTQQILFHDQTEETDGDRLRQREGWPAGDGNVPRPRTISGLLRNLSEVLIQRDADNHAQNAKDGE